MLFQNAGTFINQRGFVNRLFRYPQFEENLSGLGIIPKTGGDESQPT